MRKFSERSLNNLRGVDENLVKIVHRALEISEYDFTVVEGLRTLERQKQLFAQGATKTLDSYHLKGKAVDLYPYYDGKVQIPSISHDSWSELANAMKQAAEELGHKVTWGGTWKFVDCPHFQIE